MVARESRPRTRHIPLQQSLFVQTEFRRDLPPCSARAGPVPRRKAALAAAPDGGPGGEQGEIPAKPIAWDLSGARHVGQPRAMHGSSPLSNTVGSVLDPIVALRRTVALAPHETAIIDLVLGVTESREPRWPRWKNIKAPAWRTAPSIWPGPTAR